MKKLSEIIATMNERVFTGKDLDELKGRVFLKGNATNCMMLRSIKVDENGRIDDEFVCGVDIVDNNRIALAYNLWASHILTLVSDVICSKLGAHRCKQLFFYICDDEINWDDENDCAIPNKVVPFEHPRWPSRQPNLFWGIEQIEFDLKWEATIEDAIEKYNSDNKVEQNGK